MTLSIDRGHMDFRTPSFRIQLFAQTPMGVQADLFDFGTPGTAPAACAHRYDPCAQLTLEGGTARICTLCGESEPVGSAWPDGPVVFEFPEGAE